MLCNTPRIKLYAYKDKGKKPFLIHYATSKIENSKEHFSERDIERTDLDLIKTVEKLGEKANGKCAELKVIEIPDNTVYVISEYDGIETVEEAHKSWR